MTSSDDSQHRGDDDPFRSARAAHWIADLVVPRRLRENVWGDLREEYAARFDHTMPRGHASRWLLRELLAATPRFVVGRLSTEISLRTWLTILTSTSIGIALAYVESRPTWDDMGVLVAGIVFSAAAMGWVGSGFPWLIALAVGAWIPLHDVVVHGGHRLWRSSLPLSVPTPGPSCGAC